MTRLGDFMRFLPLSSCSAALPWAEEGFSPVQSLELHVGSYWTVWINQHSFCLSETMEPDHDVHMDICWQRLEGDNMCAEPLQGRRTTYTECCCLFGIAWSGQCAFCPRRDSGEEQNAHKTRRIITHLCYPYTAYNPSLCASAFRGLCNHVQPASQRRVGQLAGAARIRVWS